MREPTPFDTAQPGIREAEWEDWTSWLPAWSPPRNPLLVVTPHPDDETLGAGGLIHTYLRQNISVTVLSVSDGEAACPKVAALAEIRQSELREALSALGATSPRLIRMGIPDTQLARYEDDIVEAIRVQLQSGMLLAAPFEFDGHSDHDATGRAARRVVRDRSATLIRYPIWAWHRGTSPLRSVRTAVRFPLSEESWSAKQNAIGCFRSQLAERAGGAIVPPHVREYFMRRYEVFLL